MCKLLHNKYNRKVWRNLNHFCQCKKNQQNCKFYIKHENMLYKCLSCIYYLSFHLIIEAVRRDLQFKQRPFWLFNGIIEYKFDVHSLNMSRPRFVQITSEVTELFYDEIHVGLSLICSHLNEFQFSNSGHTGRKTELSDIVLKRTLHGPLQRKE